MQIERCSHPCSLFYESNNLPTPILFEFAGTEDAGKTIFLCNASMRAEFGATGSTEIGFELRDMGNQQSPQMTV